MSLTRRIARPLLSAAFVGGGIDTLRDTEPRVKMSRDIAPKLAEKVGLPKDPDLLVKINAGAQIVAGLMLSAGKFRRLSALVLIGSTIPTTYAGHRFWEAEDPKERQRQLTQFLKNASMLGGLILEVVDTEGAPSLGWRARRAARRAGGRVSTAGDRVSTAGGRVSTAGGRATSALSRKQSKLARKQARLQKHQAHLTEIGARSARKAATAAGSAASTAASSAQSGIGAGARTLAAGSRSAADAVRSPDYRHAADTAAITARKAAAGAWHGASDLLPTG